MSRGQKTETHPLAASRFLISFLTFHVWIFCSASVLMFDAGCKMAVAVVKSNFGAECYLVSF
jgi:hypothetical protein